MGIILLFLFIASVVGFVIWGVYEDGFGGAMLGILIGILVFILLLFIGFLLLGAIWACNPSIEPTEPFETIEIVALNDNYGVDGYIYRRCGSVDSELEYVYLYNVPNKGLTVGDIPADKTYLNFSNIEKPSIKVYITRPESDFLYNLFGEFNREYVITLPDNALITNEYIVDLE